MLGEGSTAEPPPWPPKISLSPWPLRCREGGRKARAYPYTGPAFCSHWGIFLSEDSLTIRVDHKLDLQSPPKPWEGDLWGGSEFENAAEQMETFTFPEAGKDGAAVCPIHENRRGAASPGPAGLRQDRAFVFLPLCLKWPVGLCPWEPDPLVSLNSRTLLPSGSTARGLPFWIPAGRALVEGGTQAVSSVGGGKFKRALASWVQWC